jgi:hypothetical protein
VSDKKRQLTGPQPVDWREFAAMQKQLDNLLSRIHGGSQYQKEHGTAKAVADAHDIVSQLFGDRYTLATEVTAWRDITTSHELRAVQAEHDRDVLAAEVEAWRHNDDVHQCDSMTDRVSVKAHDRACEASQRTDASGALTRAKEAK